MTDIPKPGNAIDAFLEALGVADPHQVSDSPLELEFVPGSDKVIVRWTGFKVVTFSDLEDASAAAHDQHRAKVKP